MYGGKYLGKLFPFLAWGTHWFINKQALSLLEKEGLKIGRDFPNLKLINIFEDFNGPDGAWIKGEYPDSKMHYNPITDEGDAPREAVRLLEKLILTLKEKDWLIKAKDAAWLSHIITDLLWPPHQLGHYKNFTAHFFFWKIKKNWYDGLTGSLWHKYDRHSKLETLTTFSFWGRKVGPLSLDHLFIQEAKNNYFLTENYLKKKAMIIKEKGVYEKFIQEGWNADIKKVIDQEIFPEIISSVATLWYLAYLLK